MIEVRPLTEEDIPAALDFQAALEISGTEKELKHFAAERKDKLLLAFKDGSIVGRCSANAYYPPYGELINMAVHPNARQQGIGDQLTQKCVEFLNENGCSIVFLQTDSDNWTAQRMYRNHQFLSVIRGQMLRMMRFSDFSPVKTFESRHELTDIVSTTQLCTMSNNRSLWYLQWRDPIKQEYLTLWIEGESCQAQSALCPTVARFHANYDQVELMAAFTGNRDSLALGEEIELKLVLHNPRSSILNVEVKLLETNGLKVDGEGAVRLVTDGKEFLPIKIKAPKSLDQDAIWYSSHDTVPVTFSINANGFEFLVSTSPRLILK